MCSLRPPRLQIANHPVWSQIYRHYRNRVCARCRMIRIRRYCAVHVLCPTCAVPVTPNAWRSEASSTLQDRARRGWAAQLKSRPQQDMKRGENYPQRPHEYRGMALCEPWRNKLKHPRFRHTFARILLQKKSHHRTITTDFAQPVQPGGPVHEAVRGAKGLFDFLGPPTCATAR
jgi:hypothetical protein